MTAPRLDRIATLYVTNPVISRLQAPHAAAPILMYHSISDHATEKGHPYYHTVTKPNVFEAQMRYLRDHGYTATTLAEAISLLGAPKSSVRPVVITFDDGFEDFATAAWPILSRYGMTATMFLPTAHISHSRSLFLGRPCLTWSTVRELLREGIHFGSHTVSHPQLRDVPPNQLGHEIRKSKETIEAKTGSPVNCFSYPYAYPEADGEFCRRFTDLLTANGYSYAVTTIIGVATRCSQRLRLERVPVNSWDDARLFGAKLQGGYNWLHWFQLASKLLRASENAIA